MLKWTVSRSLSTASSTTHRPIGGTSGGDNSDAGRTLRKPFRDLSNTPPASSSASRTSATSVSRSTRRSTIVVDTTTTNVDAMANGRSTPGVKRTPARRRRCRSQGSDLRGYFQATKSSNRSSKRQSLSQRNNNSPVIESFYQSTPRVDNDIGPLFPSRQQCAVPTQSLPHRCSTNSLTLPTDPQSLPRRLPTGAELPQNIMNEARTNTLQSHVSDFFHQISMATSPEDVMESESLPFASRRYALREERHTPYLPKLARLTKLNARNKTPYHTKIPTLGFTERGVDVEPIVSAAEVRQTPLAGKLLSLKLDQDRPMYENMDNTVTEVLNREQETNFGGKSVAEILLKDSAERRRILDTDSKLTIPRTSSPKSWTSPKRMEEEEEEHVYATIAEETNSRAARETMELDESKAAHNDSSVSSASQLLENPSPLSWPFCSPGSDLDDAGEFPLKRQRVIRRKRQANNNKDAGAVGSQSKRPRREQLPFIEAVNRHVKRLALETDLDSSITEEEPPRTEEHESGTKDASQRSVEDEATRRDPTNNPAQISIIDAVMSEETKEEKTESSQSRKRKELATATTMVAALSTSVWDTDSPKSSLLDSFATSTTTTVSGLGTPETTPLVATVRRCLKYSPETPGASAESSRSGNFLGPNRGSIEIECSAQPDAIHVKIIRCKDLRRAYEGPINAYVKASLKDLLSGEGCVKRTAVHRATPNPVFHETLVLPCLPASNNNCTARQVSLDIAVWHRDRRARRSELLGCMTLPLPLSQDKEATWHPLEAGSGRNTSSAPAYSMNQESSSLGGGGGGRGSVVSPPLSKDGAESVDNNNGTADDLTYLRHLELEPLDPLTGLPLHPGFTARGGRTPCTVTRRLVRPAASINQVAWGFSLSWGRPPRVERVDPGSPAERSGLRPGDYVVFVESTNVVTQPRDDILELIQAATNQLVLEVYRKGGHGHAVTSTSSVHRPSSVNVTLQPAPVGVQAPGPAHQHAAIAFTAEPFPSLAADASPEEELAVREQRYWTCLKSGQVRFMTPLTERRDVLAAADYLILFQNLDELLKLSEEIRDEVCALESYLSRVGRITACYRRYLGGLQRACCLLVALRKNSAFAKIVCEPAVPRRRKPDITGVLLQPLEHYREMTRLLCQACPRNCQAVRDLAQGYREATANAAMMEPPRDTGRPLLSLQEVESRLVFARCKPFALAVPGRQWLFGGALAKVEGRSRLQPTWALLLTDLLVFARVSRDRVLFVTEEPLRLACIAEACFTVRKRPTEFRLQVTTQPSAPGENPVSSSTEIVQCGGTGGGVGVGGGCSPHSRPRRRVLVLRAPSPELKAVWHNLLQRQIIYVNTGYGSGVGPGLESPDDDSPTSVVDYIAAHHNAQRELAGSPEIYRSTQQLADEQQPRPDDSLELMLKSSDQQEENHLAQWVRNSHQIPPPDQEVPIEEWTPEELAARTPKEASSARDLSEATEESTVVNSDAEQQSSASSASLSTVKSNSLPAKKNGSAGGGSSSAVSSSKETSSSSLNMCRKCHRSGCPTPRDPFSPLPPKIAVLPPTPDYCSRHRLKNGLYDSPGRNSPSRTYSADGTTEDGSEDDLDCDGEPPYRALRRFGTLSSLDQDDELEEQTGGEDESSIESPPSGLRGWTLRASSYVVSKMSILEHFGDGCLLQPPVPPERTECSSLDPNSNGDEEGTTSGGTSGDDIWGTPTSGGPDDESFTGSPPPSNGATSQQHQPHEDSYDDEQDPESEGEDGCLPELSMEQLLSGGSPIGSAGVGGFGGAGSSGSVGANSLRSFLGRRRLEPLPEEEDALSLGGSSTGSGSGGAGKYQQVGWW